MRVVVPVATYSPADNPTGGGVHHQFDQKAR